jgi:hypothetical protein
VDIRDRFESKRDNPFHKDPSSLERKGDMHRTNVGLHKMHPNWHHMPSIWEILLFPDPHRAKAETIL